MYLHKLKKPNGDIYLSIKEKYHVPGKGAREKTVKSLGYVSELRKRLRIQLPIFLKWQRK